MTQAPPPAPPPPGSYVPSPGALLCAMVLTVGIVVIALRDSFTTDYDGRQTIGIFAILIGGILGFDFRRGKWRDDAARSPSEPEAGEPDE